jgi:hypothetical protein
MLPFRLAGQDLPVIERILEERGEHAAAADHEEIASALLRLLHHPLSINEATFEELKQLVFLSDSQIDNIIRFRKRSGGFRHASELLLVTGIGRRELESILPFIAVGGAGGTSTSSSPRRRVRHEILARVRASRPLPVGYERYDEGAFLDESARQYHEERRYLGPPLAARLKYKIDSGDAFRAGFTLENDAGEPYFSRGQRAGFDFLSGYVSARLSPIVERVIVGDYRLQFGQGLVAWNGFAIGKSTVAPGNEKAGKEVVPHTSADENRFARGIAVTARPSRGMTATLFWSSKRVDASVVAGDSLEVGGETEASPDDSGYHRNRLEIAKKHALKETITGLSATYNRESFRVGARAIYYNFTPRLKTGDLPYQQYNDAGRHRVLASVDYKVGIAGVYLFGETAISDNRALATVNGLRYTVSRWLSLSALYRRYDKRYTSYYSSGFGEYSNTSNEEGIHVAIELSPLRRLKVLLYRDDYRYFAPRYRATEPGSGSETAGEALYQREKNEWSVRVKVESKPGDLPGARVKRTIAATRREYRVQYACREFLPLVESRSRLEYTSHAMAAARENGLFISHDLLLALERSRVKMQFRLAYFDIDSYNARVYVHEHDILHGVSLPAFYNRGYRSYLNANWDLSRSLTVYAKGGLTYYPDRSSIGAYLARVDDNKRLDLALQVKMNF